VCAKRMSKASSKMKDYYANHAIVKEPGDKSISAGKYVDQISTIYGRIAVPIEKRQSNESGITGSREQPTRCKRKSKINSKPTNKNKIYSTGIYIFRKNGNGESAIKKKKIQNDSMSASIANSNDCSMAAFSTSSSLSASSSSSLQVNDNKRDESASKLKLSNVVARATAAINYGSASKEVKFNEYPIQHFYEQQRQSSLSSQPPELNSNAHLISTTPNYLNSCSSSYINSLSDGSSSPNDSLSVYSRSSSLTSEAKINSPSVFNVDLLRQGKLIDKSDYLESYNVPLCNSKTTIANYLNITKSIAYSLTPSSLSSSNQSEMKAKI
jgi:hypothetical protein